MDCTERKYLNIHEKEQGFLTNLNRFVDRKEAYQIAKNANQLAPWVNITGDSENTKLFSEDLY